MKCNDICVGSISEKKEHSYIDNVTEVTRLSRFIHEKTLRLGNVFFGWNSKAEPGDRDGDGPAALDNVTKSQVEVLTEIDLMLNEILARLIG